MVQALRMSAVLPIIRPGVAGKPTATQPPLVADMPNLSRVSERLPLAGSTLHSSMKPLPRSLTEVQAVYCCVWPPTVSWHPVPLLAAGGLPMLPVLAAGGDWVVAATSGLVVAPSAEGVAAPPAKFSCVPPSS